MATHLIYGSYSYNGRLIAGEAADRKREPILAGRERLAVAEQAGDLDLEVRRSDLSNPIAPPGSYQTLTELRRPLFEQRGRTRRHLYRGWDELRRYHRRNSRHRAGQTPVREDRGRWSHPLLGDRSLVGADGLSVDAPRARSGDVPPALRGLDHNGAGRGGGRWGSSIGRSARTRPRRLEFPTDRLQARDRPAVAMPLGDVSTAHYTTGVPNVEVYVFAPPTTWLALESHRYVAPLFSIGLVREGMKRFTGASRERGSTILLREASNEDERVVSRVRMADPYAVTGACALAVAERVLDGEASLGYRTPAGEFGPEFVLGIDEAEGFFDGEMP